MSVALRPELAARVIEAEVLAAESTARAMAVEESIDEAMSRPDIAIPEEVVDIPSVVAHVDELRAESERVQRESQPPPFARISDARGRRTGYSFLSKKKM